MTVSRPRSPSPTNPVKRQKVTASDNQSAFATGLFDPANTQKRATEYKASGPFKHCCIETLFQDQLLESVKDECIKELCFKEKETDIYKVFQTGDLASLDYIDDDQRALLPSLLRLRNALYSSEFREYLRKVTGCGPLSGTKRDMSVNSYRAGCHLLNHDDVIDTRRVSYILYMPLSGTGPGEHSWRKEWGGALELYPIQEVNGFKEPKTAPSKVIPPSWNQFVFFEVQPGHSFHSVEEVVVGNDQDGRQRLSISGWFHKPQEGEEGYASEDGGEEMSSLQQLSTLASTQFRDYLVPQPELLQDHLTKEEQLFLSGYLEPSYLTGDGMARLRGHFAKHYHLSLSKFLRRSIASDLEAGLRLADEDAGFGVSEQCQIAPHTTGLDKYWEVKGPPHKLRYCVLNRETVKSPTESNHSPLPILKTLQDSLFPSSAFRSWLTLATGLLPRRHNVEARRFRPGIDYTLATSEPEERLDVCLCLTPQVGEAWESRVHGGWQSYMAAPEGEDDPAVYGSGSRGAEDPSKQTSGSSADVDEGNEGDVENIDGELSDDDDGATLLSTLAAFNDMTIVLRDAGVLRFVKYVSAACPGSRWDISSEYEVDMVEVDSGNSEQE